VVEWPTGPHDRIDSPREPPMSAALFIAGATGNVPQAVQASCQKLT
jgi:hypothetical protein